MSNDEKKPEDIRSEDVDGAAESVTDTDETPSATESDDKTAGVDDSAPADSENVPHPPPPFPFDADEDPSLMASFKATDDTDSAEQSDAAPDAEESGETGIVPVASAAHDNDDGEDEDEVEEEEEEEESPMTLVQHLDELRKRLKYIAIAAIVGCLACYGFAEELFNLLVAPMVQYMPADSSFIFTAPQEAFLTYLKVAALAGVFLTSPVIFYQIWAFVAPGLYEEERRYIVPIAFCSAIFFIGGASFGYFIVFPAAFEFFMSFNNDHIQAMLKLDEYLSFSIKLLLAFGFVFEMPLFSLVLSRIGLVTAAMMRKFRRFAVLGAFILGAVLTPPDVFSQMLMAGPLLILYELSIIVAAVFGRKRETELEDDEDEEDEEDTEEA